MKLDVKRYQQLILFDQGQPCALCKEHVILKVQAMDEAKSSQYSFIIEGTSKTKIIPI